MMTNETCLVCRVPQRALYRWNGFMLKRCAECGLESVATLPEPEELRSFYQSISGKKMVHSERRLDLVSHSFDKYLGRYAHFLDRPPVTLLDLGGGVGYYARAASDAGLEGCLMDWAEDALRFAREELHLEWTVQGDIQHCAASLEPEVFDVVLTRHTIEHLLDPRRFLAEIAKVLRPDGLVQVETPNVASNEQLAHPGLMTANYRVLRRSAPELSGWRALRHVLGKSVSGINPPKHLWGFTAPGLCQLLREEGFQILEVHCATAGHRVYDPLFYELQPSAGRSWTDRLHRVWQRMVSPAFSGRGMNLVVLARRTA